MKVDVYYNLHKKLFSIRHNGRVIKHTTHVDLVDATFVVQPAGRAKVLAEGKKNVHAFVRGTLAKEVQPLAAKGRQVTYNPYKYASFVDAITEEPISSTAHAALSTGDGWTYIWAAD